MIGGTTMYERMHLLNRADFDKIHQATLEIFKDVGVAFHEPEALEIFSGAGARGKYRREDCYGKCFHRFAPVVS